MTGVSEDAFIKTLQQDADYMALNNTMDYSLLIGQILVLSDNTRV